MYIYNNNELNLESSIISIGAFDGLHRGHQTLIRQAVHRARELNVPSVVYTFNSPPRAFFQNSIVLTSLNEKIELIKQFEVDYIVVANFNEQYASRPASAFIEELCSLAPKEIFVGPNFTFGKGKKGDVCLLSENFKVNVQPLITCENGEIISSTRIRNLLKKDKQAQVSKLLGREYHRAVKQAVSQL
ncbi:FAD synthetase [Alteribacillus sp. JSM 102045]|uniref:FAD synthetase n=1 Tax=Alteribacillus sp. JSM 102045 TaxID=1562101 RepID=UPI0035C0F3E3